MELLKQPIRIKELELENRLVMPPMATSTADTQGNPSEQTIAYYDEKTKSGLIGLVIVEHSFVSKQGQARKGQLSISDDQNIEGLKRLVDTIHNNGSKVIAQLSHAGKKADPQVLEMEVVDPDSLSIDQIQEIIEEFGQAARRAKEAGFDGVEIHSAHGYLLNQFYSPLTNHRRDEYSGKTLDGRLKIHQEIIKKVREVVGEKYPIALRLGACDYQEGGTVLKESVEAAKILEQAGIDLLDISGGLNGYRIPGHDEEGYFKELTGPIKAEVSIPVILTGGIKNAQGAQALLEEKVADLIGVGRAILIDSSWPEKNMQ